MPTKNLRLRPSFRLSFRFAFPLAAAVVLAPAVLSCGRVPGQFIVVQNQVPLQQSSCTIPAELGANYRPDGTLDASLVRQKFGDGYVLFPLLENDLPGPTTGQNVDGNRIALSGFDVQVELTTEKPPQAVLDVLTEHAAQMRYSVPTSGSVSSGGGHTASFVNVFPADLAAALHDRGAIPQGSFLEFTAHVRARGDKLSGAIESDSFAYPLHLCDGCLVATVQACPAASKPANDGNPCNIAQDAPIDCCSIGSDLVCPSVVATQ